MSHLLVVDDEPDFLEELAESLALRGLPTVCVRRAADAVEAVGANRDISIVITDIRMPDMDGVSLIEALKIAFPDRHMKFVVMTGHASEEDIRRAEAAGAAACFPKPFALEPFCEVLVKLGGRDGRS
ncbi:MULTISPECIES: response regulator [Xanthobacter]|uniref:response regulator n=1 Tax=Xanthobacter TaxID=279 RepID=UPI001F2D0383|nr:MULTISPECIES: response regulator [unclassified Xanthobacter]